MSAPLLKVTSLDKRYKVRRGMFGHRDLVAAEGIDLSIARGETLALVGESGSGKSTVGRCVLRLEEPSGGRVELDGTDVSTLSAGALQRMRARAQMVFQDPLDSLNPRHKIGSLIAEPLLLHAMETPKTVNARVAELLELVGLRPEHAERYAHQLSGGQQQRVGIARAIATRPSLIVLDEPTSALDVSVEAQILNLLMELRSRFDLAYLFISHDLEVVRLLAQRVAVMYLGQIVEIGPTHDVLTASFHPYTRSLVSATPIQHPREKKERIVMEGEPASPIEPPQHCRLVSRCPFVRPVCSEVPTVLTEVTPGHATRCVRFLREHKDGVWQPAEAAAA